MPPCPAWMPVGMMRMPHKPHNQLWQMTLHHQCLGSKHWAAMWQGGLYIRCTWWQSYSNTCCTSPALIHDNTGGLSSVCCITLEVLMCWVCLRFKDRDLEQTWSKHSFFKASRNQLPTMQRSISHNCPKIIHECVKMPCNTF